MRDWARSRRRGRPLLGAAAFAVGLLALSPLVYLVVRGAERGTGHMVELATEPRTLELLWRSFSLAAVVTVACVVLGTVLAWLTVRSDLPGRRWFAVVLTVPLAVPSYVTGYIWIAEFPQVAGFFGAALVLTVASFPYVFLPVAAALVVADPGVEEVARTLGRSRWNVALTVTARQVWPAAAAGGLLVALYTLHDFGAVALMRYEAFTVAIYNSYRGSFDRTPAAVLGLVLVAAALVLTVVERAARRSANARVGSGAPRRAEPVRLGAWAVPAMTLVLGVVAVSVVVPAAALARWLARSQQLDVDWSRVLSSTVTTVQVAGLGALAVTLLALPVGVYAARSRSLGARLSESVSYVGFALPGITVGLAVVFLGIRVLPQFYQKLPMLVLAYVVLFLPLAVGAVRSTVEAIPEPLEDVSATLGESRLGTGARVLLPLALPGVLAGGALAFLTIAKELPATLLLRPTGADTLATRMWAHTDVLAYGQAAPYAAALILVAALPALVLGHQMGWSGARAVVRGTRQGVELEEAKG